MSRAVANDAESEELLLPARRLLEQALAYLDDSQAPGQIGAYIDHAIACLDRHISTKQSE